MTGKPIRAEASTTGRKNAFGKKKEISEIAGKKKRQINSRHLWEGRNPERERLTMWRHKTFRRFVWV